MMPTVTFQNTEDFVPNPIQTIVRNKAKKTEESQSQAQPQFLDHSELNLSALDNTQEATMINEKSLIREPEDPSNSMLNMTKMIDISDS